jgi:hypothetical protein
MSGWRSLIFLLWIFPFVPHGTLAAGNLMIHNGQVTIEPGPVSFALPNGWIQAPHKVESENMAMYMFGRPLTDSEGNTIIPACTFIIEPTDLTDVVFYSITKRIAKPGVEVEQVFTSERGIFSIMNAVALKGRMAIDSSRNMELILLHAINERSGIGLQVSCEAPGDLFTMVEEDFLSILKSLRFTRKME